MITVGYQISDNIYFFFLIGEVVCRFFEGLHREFKNPVAGNFHDTFRINGVHNYFQDSDKFQYLRAANSADQEFDSAFFQWIISEFTK